MVKEVSQWETAEHSKDAEEGFERKNQTHIFFTEASMSAQSLPLKCSMID